MPSSSSGGDPEQNSQQSVTSAVSENVWQRRRLDENGTAVPGSQDSDLAARTERSLRLRETAVVDAVADATRVQPGRIEDGCYTCPWCSFRTAHVNGLMTHATRMHPAQRLGAEEASYWNALGRGACRACGYTQPMRSRQCSRCQESSSTRAVRAGDMVVPSVAAHAAALAGDETRSDLAVGGAADGLAAAAVIATAVSGDTGNNYTPESERARTANAPPAPSGRGVEAAHESRRAANRQRRPRRMGPGGSFSFRFERREAVTRQRRGLTPSIPVGFLADVRAIPGSSLVHIPKALRDAIAAYFCDCLEGSLEGDPAWSYLVETFTKLVLYGIPSGITADAEIASRLALWEQDRLGELLQRIKTQATARGAGVERNLEQKRTGAAEARAMRMAREGAKAKACGGLVGGVKNLSVDEQRRWARELFPQSATPVTTARRIAVPGAGNPARPTPPVAANETPVTEDIDAQWAEHPLKGISFPPMSGTGPSNCRPEHMNEMLGTRKNALKRRLFRLLEEAVEKGLKGELPDTLRWILGSSATFLEKLGHETSRPIRCGEWLRKVIAKVFLRRHKLKIRQAMLRLRQFGVMIPGGAEALHHARTTIEEIAADGQLGPLVAVDVDMKNFFGSVEWEATESSYRELLPEGLPWVSWCQAAPVSVSLPCKQRIASDRGAGQGEPDGPLKASLPLGREARNAQSDLQEHSGIQFAHAWFMDDGQIFCRPEHLDAILKRLDHGLAAIGATRGNASRGEDIKSNVKSFGCEHVDAGVWATPYVRDSCKIRAEGDATKLLGGALGPAAHHAALYGQAVEKTSVLHDAIGAIPNAATQMVLRSACADVSKVAYILRLAGDKLDATDLDELGKVQRAGVGTTLNGDVGDDAWEQATTEVRLGGLGLRSATELALPSFIASRVAGRSIAAGIFSDLENAGLAPVGVLLGAYDRRLQEAVSSLESQLQDDDLIRNIRTVVETGLQANARWWDLANAGQDVPGSLGEAGAGQSGGGSGTNLDDDVGEADQLTSLQRAAAIQNAITSLIDKAKLRRLRCRFDAEGFEEDVRRLDDLQDTSAQQHTWWQALNPQISCVLPEEEWVIAMRIRLGAPVLPVDGVCGCCGSQRIDARGYHALCCAMGESTKGHNRIRDVIADCCARADPGTAIEVPGLCPDDPGLRPADVLTRAVHPTLAIAVDVGVRAPHAAGAGENPLESMRAQKIEKYARHAHALERQGISYEPAIFSCYGRWHPRATQMINHAAARAARRTGHASNSRMLGHWRQNIAAQLWLRAARMTIACFPKRQRFEDEDDDVD